jgi:hypothetical protein
MEKMIFCKLAIFAWLASSMFAAVIDPQEPNPGQSSY